MIDSKADWRDGCDECRYNVDNLPCLYPKIMGKPLCLLIWQDGTTFKYKEENVSNG